MSEKTINDHLATVGCAIDQVQISLKQCQVHSGLAAHWQQVLDEDHRHHDQAMHALKQLRRYLGLPASAFFKEHERLNKERISTIIARYGYMPSDRDYISLLNLAQWVAENKSMLQVA